jgi:hypothetical protein
MRKIWFFGDSSTFCHGLRPGFEYWEKFPNLRNKTWVEYICDYFGGEEINFGFCGASNEDIKFRIITNLYKIDVNDIVIMQSTHPTRINVFDKYGDFRPVHIAFNNETSDDFSKEELKSLKDYSKNFLVDNVDRFERRDSVIFLSLKNELEKRNVKTIFWNHQIMNQEVRNYFGWKNILDESGGVIDDNYHLGWESQQSFAQLLISNYEAGNTSIIPTPDMYEDVSNIQFNNRSEYDTLESLYEDVRHINKTKHYDEGHIFIQDSED